MFILSACGCDHEWTNATCLSPKTCNLCGKTKGNTTDHNYMDANCDHPKRCSFCDYTVGKALGHNYIDGCCTKCSSRDPNYVDLNYFGYINNYGMNTWVQITSYSFGENYVEAYIFDVRSYDYNYVENGGVFADNFDYFLKNPTTNITDSNCFKISNREQCKYMSNDTISIYDDGFWEQSSIFDRAVNTNNSKLVIKTLNHNSDEVWFVPCDLLDFTTIKQIDDRHFYVEFKE